MGQNFGLITTITENQIQLRELIQDAVGDWTETPEHFAVAGSRRRGNNEYCPHAKIHSGGDLPFRLLLLVSLASAQQNSIENFERSPRPVASTGYG